MTPALIISTAPIVSVKPKGSLVNKLAVTMPIITSSISKIATFPGSTFTAPKTVSRAAGKFQIKANANTQIIAAGTSKAVSNCQCRPPGTKVSKASMGA